MKHVARRGVCIGVDRHLKAGDPVPSDLDAAQVQFLVGIGAVEVVPDEPIVVSVVPDEPVEIKTGAEEPKPEAFKKKK